MVLAPQSSGWCLGAMSSHIRVFCENVLLHGSEWQCADLWCLSTWARRCLHCVLAFACYILPPRDSGAVRSLARLETATAGSAQPSRVAQGRLR